MTARVLVNVERPEGSTAKEPTRDPELKKAEVTPGPDISQ
jgi:hypothetical protein